MQFGFLKDDEPRVSITPSTLDKFISLGHKVFIEKDAGFQSGFPDSEYSNATFYSRKDLINNSDIILSVSSSSLGSLNDYKGKILISNFSVDPNREKLKTANSFMLTLQKDSSSDGQISRRINGAYVKDRY